VEVAALISDEIFGLIYRCNVQTGYVGAGFGEACGDALS
jgi:hypothetical protein